MAKGNTGKKGSAGIGVLLIVIGVIIAIVGVVTFVAGSDVIFRGADDINTMIAENRLEAGEFTNVRIDADFGAYRETKRTICGFIPVGKEQHYMVWLDDGSIISVTVKGKSTYEKLDAIEEQTYDYMQNGGYLAQSMTFTGKVTEISGDLADYYQEALDNVGVDESTANILYLDIDTTKTKASVIGWSAVMLALGMILLVVGIVKALPGKKE
jgi:hypothetical protein